MLLIRSLFFGLIGSVAANGLSRRDVSTVLADFQNISMQTDALTTQVNNFQGFANLQDLLTATNNLISAIDKGTSDASSLSNVAESDQASLLSAAEALLPKIYQSLNAVEAKKATFDSNGLTSSVVTELQMIMSSTDKFGAALSAAATGDYKTAAQALLSEIDAAFVAAETFSSLPATTAIPIPSPSGGAGPTTETSAGATTTPTSGGGGGITTPTVSVPISTPSSNISIPITTPTLPITTPGATTSIPLTMYTGGAVATGLHFGAAMMAVAAFAL